MSNRTMLACLGGCFVGFSLAFFLALAFLICQHIDKVDVLPMEKIFPFFFMIIAAFEYTIMKYLEGK